MTRARAGDRQETRTPACMLRFLAVGASGVAVNLVAFAALDAAGVQVMPAAAGAFAVAVANNFWWNRIWTFSARSSGPGRRQALRFLAVSVGAFLLTTCLLILASTAGAPPRIAQAISIAATTPLSFALNQAWTFTPRFPDQLLEAGR
jgi:dolichol-phosphate mannosyltransferase